MKIIKIDSNILTCTVCRAPLEENICLEYDLENELKDLFEIMHYSILKCKDCEMIYIISTVCGYVAIRKHFKHENIDWTMSYYFKTNQTAYISNHRDKTKKEGALQMLFPDRTNLVELVLDGMILPEQFVKLTAFL